MFEADCQQEENDFLKKVRQAMGDLSKQCYGCLYQHFDKVVAFYQNEFLELKHFKDPITSKLLGYDPLNGQNNMPDALAQILSPANDRDGNPEDKGTDPNNNLCTRMLLSFISDNWLNQVTVDFTPYIALLCRVRNVSSVFEVLACEKRRILEEVEESGLACHHEWTINEIEKLKIEEDNPFFHDNVLWKLGVTYSKQNQSSLKITINLVQDPFRNKKC